MRIRRVVDLSLPLDAGTQVYPGDPVVSFRQAATIENEGFNLLSIHLGSQSGTNCDAPYHFRQDAAPIDEVDLDLFVGPGVVIDVRGRPPRTAISTVEVAPYLDAVTAGTIVLLHTGWPAHYGTHTYFDHPFLAADACEMLLARGARTFCLDTQNIDETPDAEHPGAGFPVHHLIARAGGIIVENLTGLEQITFDQPLITVFPLRLTGADGSPTRAVAMQIEV
jgi:kynurenine formamidase